MKKQKSRCGATEYTLGMKKHKRKVWTDKHRFNNQCREERNE
jgi:hypothetical protein